MRLVALCNSGWRATCPYTFDLDEKNSRCFFFQIQICVIAIISLNYCCTIGQPCIASRIFCSLPPPTFLNCIGFKLLFIYYDFSFVVDETQPQEHHPTNVFVKTQQKYHHHPARPFAEKSIVLIFSFWRDSSRFILAVILVFFFFFSFLLLVLHIN